MAWSVLYVVDLFFWLTSFWFLPIYILIVLCIYKLKYSFKKKFIVAPPEKQLPYLIHPHLPITATFLCRRP